MASDLVEELQELWEEKKGKNKSRAAFFTLFIVGKKERAAYQKLISKFPCRVVFIQPDQELKSSVHLMALSEEIYCEIIEVQGEIKRLPSLVLPLILPDLPVYLLWSGPFESSLFDTLKRVAKKVIIDSDKGQDLKSHFENSRKLKGLSSCSFADLNWTALRGWRSLLSNYFILLLQTREIKIIYNPPAIKAALLQGWLSSLLKWKFKRMEERGNDTLLYYEEQTLILSPQEVKTLPPGALFSIEVKSGKERTLFQRSPTTNQVFLNHTTDQACDLPKCLFLSAHPEGEEIIQEIFYPQEEKLYMQIVEKLPW